VAVCLKQCGTATAAHFRADFFPVASERCNCCGQLAMSDDDECGDANVNKNDPDYIALHPPCKVGDPKQHFTTGIHDGKWSEYDERGVPAKSIKKKKPTKKEKDQLEQEYLDVSKAYQKYLKDVEAWEQSKVDAEAELEKTDKLRWAFRRIGEKTAPIALEDFEQFVKNMGWTPLSKKELVATRKGLQESLNRDGKLELEALRIYLRDSMRATLLEVRLGLEHLDDVNPDDFYSPRTWRKKLEQNPCPIFLKGRRASFSPRQSQKKKPSPKGQAAPRTSVSPGQSPRATNTAKVVQGIRKTKSAGSKSPRTSKKESDRK